MVMQRGRPLGMQKGNPAERKIIMELEKGSSTFTGLKKQTGIAYSTLSEHLKELEKNGMIEREYKKGKILIRLPYAALTPIERTLRHLESTVPSPQKLDIELGRKLLTDEVVNAILEISTLSSRKFGLTPQTPECHHPTIVQCYKEREGIIKGVFAHLGAPFKKLEIDEYHLLRALARFYVELCLVNAFKRVEFDRLSYLLTIDFPPPEKLTVKDLEAYNQKEQIIQLLKRRKDSEVLPALEIARLTGTIKQFERLLAWIRPLTEFPDPSLHELINFVWMNDIQIGFPSWNLAGEVFRLEISNYFENTLVPSWHEKSAPQSRGEKEKEKGGEKV
jgi:DNA-binding transcriptional ArsR family regulator